MRLLKTLFIAAIAVGLSAAAATATTSVLHANNAPGGIALPGSPSFDVTVTMTNDGAEAFPSIASNRLIVGSDIPEASASCLCSQRSNARAARICSPVNIILEA